MQGEGLFYVAPGGKVRPNVRKLQRGRLGWLMLHISLARPQDPGIQADVAVKVFF